MSSYEPQQGMDLYKSDISVLNCKLCSKMMIRPVMVTACSHRFCEGCMNSYRRAHNRTCPSCSRSLVTTDGEDTVVFDPVFDGIINSRRPKQIRNVNGVRLNHSKVVQLRKQLRQRRKVQNEVRVVLWPDVSARRLPRAASRVRFIITDGSTTVHHLAKFILIRTKLESKWVESNPDEFLVEFAPVLYDQPNFRPDQLPPTAVLLCQNLQPKPNRWKLSDSAASSIDDGHFDTPNQMLAVRYPFQPIPNSMGMSEVEQMYYKDRRKTFKLLFRIFPKQEMNGNSKSGKSEEYMQI